MLVAAAELLGRADGFAERSVEAGGVFGGVGEDARVDEPGSLECAADRADPPVHHVGGGHHVGARIRVRARLAHQGFDGQVVLDIAGRRRSGRPGRGS